MRHNVAAWCRLMLVTDDRLLAGRDPVAVALAAERGGATAVQLRLKDASPRELAGLARRMVAALSIPLLVNDRPDVALAAGAAGVHLGPDDLPVEMARKSRHPTSSSGPRSARWTRRGSPMPQTTGASVRGGRPPRKRMPVPASAPRASRSCVRCLGGDRAWRSVGSRPRMDRWCSVPAARVSQWPRAYSARKTSRRPLGRLR